MSKVIYEFNSGEQIQEFFEDEVNNILMNMSAGVLPCHLSRQECELLKQKFGENWFYKLGYDDSYDKSEWE